MIYNRYDIVKVPFPFTDRQTNKVRPALVISSADAFNSPIGHSVMAMITSAAVSPGWDDSLQKAQGNLPIRSAR